MTKKKQKETAYEKSWRTALVGLHDAQDEAREAFDRAFERLEAKASGRLEKIVGEARGEATALAAALQEVLAESHAAAAELRDGAAAECAAVVQRVEDVAAEREAAVERVYTETTARFRASQDAVDQHAEQLAAVAAEAEGHRVAMQDARAATEAVSSELETQGRERLAEADRRSQESLAELGVVVAELRDGAAAECAAAVQRVEAVAAEREAAVKRVYTETTDRFRATQDAVEQHTEQLAVVVAQLRDGAAAECAAAVQRVEDVAAEREAAVERVYTATVGRFGSLQDGVDEHAEQLAAVVADAEGHRVAMQDARAAAEAVSSELATRVAELRDGAAAECSAAVQRVLEAAAEREAAVKRVYTETTDRFRATQDAVDQHTEQLAAAVAQLRDGAAAECTAAVQRVEGVAAEREAAVERVYTETTDRFRASQDAVDQHTEQLAAAVAQLRDGAAAECTAAVQRVEGVAAERAKRRWSVSIPRRRTGSASQDAVDQHTEQLAAAVAQLRDGAAAECTAAVQRVEGVAAEREAAVERVYTETTARFRASQDAVDQHTEQLGEQAARHIAELLVAVDGDVQQLPVLARQRMEEALTAVEEKFSAVLSAAVERSSELLARAEADGQALHDQREQSDRVAALADDTDDADDAEEARFVDSVPPESETEAPEWLIPGERVWTAGAVQPSDELEAAAATAAMLAETAEEMWGNDAPNDDDFFSRLAAELQDDPDQGEYPRGHEPDDEGVSAWAAPPAGTVLSPSKSEQRVAVLETATAQPLPSQPVGVNGAATKAVNVMASLAAVTACVEELARGAAKQSLRMELAKAGPQSNGGSYLRLTAYDSAGWWEYHDVEVTADSDEAAPTVVDISELRDALGTLSRFVGSSTAQIVLDGNVTIGNHLLMARDADEVPTLSDDRKAIERVDLQRADDSGLMIESQIGRLFVPRDLLGCLKRRQASAIELVTVDGLPCLSAQLSGTSDTPGMIVARLQELGEDDVPAVTERRNTNENAVTQLVSALSTATTPEELSRILKVGVGYVRRRAAAHPALAKDTILDLIREGTEAMRAAAASNVSIGKVASDLAGADPSSLVRATVAANPAVTEAGLEQLAADPVAQVRAHAASNPAITPELLEQLAEDDDSSVRAAVASHEKVALETLLVLARDPDPSVCAAVASNPAGPADMLNELVGIVPFAVLANPNASKTLLAAGSIVDEPRLRATVAANPATPVKRLRKLAQDNDPDVLRAIADHPATPRNARRRARRQLEARNGNPDA